MIKIPVRPCPHPLPLHPAPHVLGKPKEVMGFTEMFIYMVPVQAEVFMDKDVAAQGPQHPLPSFPGGYYHSTNPVEANRKRRPRLPGNKKTGPACRIPADPPERRPCPSPERCPFLHLRRHLNSKRPFPLTHRLGLPIVRAQLHKDSTRGQTDSRNRKGSMGTLNNGSDFSRHQDTGRG